MKEKENAITHLRSIQRQKNDVRKTTMPNAQIRHNRQQSTIIDVDRTFSLIAQMMYKFDSRMCFRCHKNIWTTCSLQTWLAFLRMLVQVLSSNNLPRKV